MCFPLHGGGGGTAGFEGEKGIFCLFWKTGGVKGKMWIPCYSISECCTTLILWRSFPLVKLKWFSWREALLDRVPAGEGHPTHVPKALGPKGLCCAAWNIPGVGIILEAVLGKFRRLTQRRGSKSALSPCFAALWWGLGALSLLSIWLKIKHLSVVNFQFSDLQNSVRNAV